ncbi:Dbl homology domain-containing protein [Zopfia rhizophila CBS 207.26]|uniref:Dbl homology domain-containing protein n=1 Tax=Zopfia rhizophila CBS 207.26 TaxID=1314779 RepID=A0A6A6E1R4_9PEZI|nr:Dbl homology domain-containing protein [Zopfia rhizophila CBS 207.26]
MSFSSSAIGSRTGSVFSGLSLADISIISVIALPLCQADICNSHHYAFGSIPKENALANDVPESSLFYDCIRLRKRLSKVPGIEEILLREIEEAEDDDRPDPVTVLWRAFQRGVPLKLIYSAMPPKLAKTGNEWDSSLISEGKEAAYVFLRVCIIHWALPPKDCFSVSDLYADNVMGFQKVVKTINRVLDMSLTERNIDESFHDKNDMLKDDNRIPGPEARAHILRGFLKEERKYVKQLEKLHLLKTILQEGGFFSSDDIHDLFGNLHMILDFQLRFLIRIEMIKLDETAEHSWGSIFSLYRPAFKVHLPYIENQKKSMETAKRLFVGLRTVVLRKPSEIEDIVESLSVLTSYLIRPVTRFFTYPAFLKRLLAAGEWMEPQRYSIERGLTDMQSIVDRANEIISRQERLDVVEDLARRVVDWKGYNLRGLGELLLFGDFPVITDYTRLDKKEERQYSVYLFEMVIFACKPAPAVAKRRLLARTTTTNQPQGLELKGRILFQNVTETLSLSRPGNYTTQILWEGDPGIQTFIIRFPNERLMREWTAAIKKQLQFWDEHRRKNPKTTEDISTST